MLTDLQYVSGLLRSSLSSAGSRSACPDGLALSATDTDRGLFIGGLLFNLPVSLIPPVPTS